MPWPPTRRSSSRACRPAAGPSSPWRGIRSWLGLPAVAGLTLVFAVLRKELALQLLVALAAMQYGAGAASLSSFMTREQIYVYALVNTLYMPCVATLAVLGRELGWRTALAIGALITAGALAVGGVVHGMLRLF